MKEAWIAGTLEPSNNRGLNPMSKNTKATKPAVEKTAPRQAKLATAAPVKKSTKLGFAVGDKVNHKLFGAGKVLSLRGDVLSIQFGKVGTKEVLADFIAAG
jgi:hypothetical protein